MRFNRTTGAGSALINVMLAAAEKAGRSLVRSFGEIEKLQVAVTAPMIVAGVGILLSVVGVFLEFKTSFGSFWESVNPWRNQNN